MALTLTVETGSVVANANTYISLADAETYFESRLHIADWTAAEDATKNAALVWSTRLLDAEIDWYGSKVDEDSALRWPRVGVDGRDGEVIDTDEIPEELKQAVCEYALYLIGEDRTGDPDGVGLKRVKADVLEVEFDRTWIKSVVPSGVYDLIAHLGGRQSSVSHRLVRV